MRRVGELVVEHPVEVGLGQAERGGLEQLVGVAGRVELERVEVGQVMADLAIGVDQAGDAGLRTAPRRDRTARRRQRRSGWPNS